MKRIRKPSRRISLIILISLACILLDGIYTWQSLRAWSDYETRLMNERKAYDALRDQALTADTPDSRLAAIRMLDDKLAKRSELCGMNGLYAWQATVLPPLKAGVQECEATVRQLGLIAAPLTALRDYLEASAKVQDIIGTLGSDATFTDSNWVEKGRNKATAVRDELKKLSVTGDAAKLKEQAIELSNSLVASWDSLIKANDAKDKSAFLSASAAVTKAYADFMSLADATDAAITDKVDALNTAVGDR